MDYERLLNAIAEGILFADREGKLTYANAGAERILGVSMEAILGRGTMILHGIFPLPQGEPLTGEQLPWSGPCT